MMRPCSGLLVAEEEEKEEEEEMGLLWWTEWMVSRRLIVGLFIDF